MSDPKINYDRIMKFEDIPDGAHFRELGKTPRTFIKLKLTFGCGDPFQVFRVIVGEDDEPHIAAGHEINCVDYQGYGGKCPPWVEFEVIDKPV